MLINKTILYVSEATSVLGCSTYRIYFLIHTGILPAYKDEGGKTWHIPEQSIKDYVATHLNATHSRQ